MSVKKKNAAPAARYRVGTLEKGLDVMEALERSGAPMNIQQLAAVTGVQRAAVFRLLCTLASRGYVSRLPDKRYVTSLRRRRMRIGFMAPLEGNAFRVSLLEGLRAAAVDAHIDLMPMDNPEAGTDVAVRNAERLIEERADLAVMFEPVGSIGHVVADRFVTAGIPLISVDTPVPGAIYFGANNYQAGRLAGRALARFARERWRGRYDRVVLLESSLSSAAVQARVTGVLVGLGEVLGDVPESRVVHLDGRAHLEDSRAAMAEYLKRTSKPERLLISGFNDLAAVGAVQALRAAGREESAAVAGQNASSESHIELRNPNSALVATIAYFPERYGEKLLRLAVSVVNREAVPPTVYTEHAILTHDNIQQFYGRQAG